MNIDAIASAPRICCICREELIDWPSGANNPDPITADGTCCNSCDDTVVIPARETQR